MCKSYNPIQKSMKVKSILANKILIKDYCRSFQFHNVMQLTRAPFVYNTVVFGKLGVVGTKPTKLIHSYSLTKKVSTLSTDFFEMKQP